MDSSTIESMTATAMELITSYGLRVLGAIAILMVGRIASGVLSGAVVRAMRKANVYEALITFARSLVAWGVMVFAVIAALNQFGVQTASFIAVLGAAGFATGLALQGSLSNFAAGVLILLFRPFKIGDFIDAGGSKGSVKEISILTTVLSTPDNQKIIIPNSSVMSGTIINVNAYDTRRVGLTAGISYGDDIGKAKQVLLDLVAGHPKVLKDPAPTIEVVALADSSVNFVVRPWVKTPDYWSVYWELTRGIKEALDKNGISIPFPQRDVHLFQATS
jgi:small conductance mechanosensitive channel